MKGNTGLTKFADYFGEQFNIIATEGGPVQVEIKSDATNVDLDPILASNGAGNKLAFNWKWDNNGVRVVLTDVGHHSGTLEEDINDDGNHGLGNSIYRGWDKWDHDASVIQGNCRNYNCKIQGTDQGGGLISAFPAFGNYAFYVTQSSCGTCPLFVSLF
eukprot:scaffold145183_cov39-Attheya_sp.AAC.1